MDKATRLEVMISWKGDPVFDLHEYGDDPAEVAVLKALEEADTGVFRAKASIEDLQKRIAAAKRELEALEHILATAEDGLVSRDRAFIAAWNAAITHPDTPSKA